MAVSAGGTSVIVRNLSIERHLPEGQKAFERACPNSTFCSDGTLSRVGFMVLEDASAFIEWLRSVGFVVLRDGRSAEVALTNRTYGFLYPCDWLEMGLFEGRPIAWMKGTEPGELFIPDFEWNSETFETRTSDFEEQYQYVETRNNVEVYRNKTTGQEVYIGRTQSGETAADRESHADLIRHERTYAKAAKLALGELVLDGASPPGKPGFVVRRRLRRAKRLLEDCIDILPRHWPSYFLIGKIHERFGDYARAFQAYQTALETSPAQPLLVKEASVAAFNLGMYQTAMDLTRIAIKVNPDDPALHSNLAVSHLLQGDSEAAVRALETAGRVEPEHNLTQSLLVLARKVQSGEIPCPSTVQELQRRLRKI